MTTDISISSYHREPWRSRDESRSTPDASRPLFIENELQWGSDPSFCYHGFSCPVGSWTEERLVRNLMRNMASMCNSMDINFNYEVESADSKSGPHYSSFDPSHLNGLSLSEYINNRRSSTPASSSSPSSVASSRKRKPDSPSTDTTDRPSLKKNQQRKRKCVQKPGQNLCHCQTEKKRREVIAQGYQTLSNLVPALGNHHYTRKYVLNGAADYIVSLLQGNEELRLQLDGMVKSEEHDVGDLFEGDEVDVPL